MTFLKAELDMFEQVRTVHDERIQLFYGRARQKYIERRDELDKITPIHHRQPPGQLVQELETKPRRLKAMISKDGWEHDAETLQKIQDEAMDIINYAAFLGALAELLEEEA